MRLVALAFALLLAAAGAHAAPRPDPDPLVVAEWVVTSSRLERLIMPRLSAAMEHMRVDPEERDLNRMFDLMEQSLRGLKSTSDTCRIAVRVLKDSMQTAPARTLCDDVTSTLVHVGAATDSALLVLLEINRDPKEFQRRAEDLKHPFAILGRISWPTPEQKAQVVEAAERVRLGRTGP